MHKNSLPLLIIFQVFGPLSALSQLHGVVTNHNTLPAESQGTVARTNLTEIQLSKPKEDSSSSDRSLQTSSQKKGTTADQGDLTINPSSRTLGQSYRKETNGNKQILFGGPHYKAKQPVPTNNDDDDIIDHQSIVGSIDQKSNPDDQVVKTTKQGLSERGGTKRKVTRRKRKRKDGKVTNSRSRSRKQGELRSSESILNFVEDSEIPKTSESQPKAQGRSFDSQDQPTAATSTSNSDLTLDTDKNVSVKRENIRKRKISLSRRKKARKWWKKLLFDPDFMEDLNSKSSSGSLEIVWIESKNKDSPSVLIIPQKVYEVDYKVYREGNHQRNTYHTNITPTTGGQGVRIVQNPVQINKDHLGEDKKDGVKWLSDLIDLDSESSEGPTSSTTSLATESPVKKMQTGSSATQAGRNIEASRGDKLTDIINKAAAKAQRDVKFENTVSEVSKGVGKVSTTEKSIITKPESASDSDSESSESTTTVAVPKSYLTSTTTTKGMVELTTKKPN